MRSIRYIGAQKIIKEQRYIRAIYVYGIVPLLLLLDEYEEQEDWTECEIIYRAIQFINEHDNEAEKLPTKYSPKAFENLKEQFSLFGFKGDCAIGNMSYYIQEIKEMTRL